MSEDADKAKGGKPPLSRSLGQFFGILIKAAKEDVGPPKEKAVVVKEEVMEKVVETEGGKITLRRRVIDEVVEGESGAR